MNREILQRNNVRVFGKGSQPMLFVHGFGCDQNMWRFIVPAFEEDYKIVLMDYVGAGKSDIKAYNAERYSNLNGYLTNTVQAAGGLGGPIGTAVAYGLTGILAIVAFLKNKRLTRWRPLRA